MTQSSCPAGKKACSPINAPLDESGTKGLEEERRLAYVGITRAKKRAKIYVASNRRIHGLWQNSIPSRFLDELPSKHVEIEESQSTYGGYGASGVGGSIYGKSRFDSSDPFENSYDTPGWKRAQANKANRSKSTAPKMKRATTTIEGELIAKSVSDAPSKFALGERVFHIKFGYGEIKSIEGNKLTIQFQTGQKRVLGQFR